MTKTYTIPGTSCQRLRPRVGCPFFEANLGDFQDARNEGRRAEGVCNHPSKPGIEKGEPGEILCDEGEGRWPQRQKKCPFGRKPLVLTVEVG